MFLRNMKFVFYKKIANYPDFFIILFLLFLTLFVRFPFWFRAVMDWDESTYILMAQSMLDGKLLYRDLWDINPPLSHASFALFIGLFGKSIVAVRACGAFCVLLSAVLTYYMGRKIYGRLGAVLAAATFVLAASLLHGGQTTMTEHIALVPLLVGVLILLRRSFPLHLMLALGALVSVAALVRFNLAFLAVVIGVIVLLHPSHENLAARVKAGAAYAVGGLVVVALTAFPYLMAGEGAVWGASVVVAPLAHAGITPPFDAFQRLIGAYFRPMGPTFWFSSLFLVLSLSSIGWAIYKMITERSEHRLQIAIVIVVTVGIAVSLISGGVYSHYLLLLAPFLSLFAAVAVIKCLFSRAFVPATAVFLSVVAVVLLPTFQEYRFLATRAAAGEALIHGPAYEIADFVESLGLADYTIFLMSDHIVYWLLDKRPPTRIAHPANMVDPYMLGVVSGKGATTKTEIAAIFDRSPTIVVKREREWYMRDFPDDRHYLDQRLESYDLVRVIENRRIYLLKDTLPDGVEN